MIGYVFIAVVLSFVILRGKPLLSKLSKIFFAWYMNKMNHVLATDLKPAKDKMFSCLHQMLNRPLKVVEIAAGSGANFDFYPENTEILCVEPNEHSKSYIDAKAADYPHLKVEFHAANAEDMSFVESESVDAVVGTYALCTIADEDKVLKEVKRILKKGGKYIFIEHQEAKKGSLDYKLQHLIRGPCYVIFEGCNLTRRQHIHIQKAGFQTTDLEFFEMPMDRYRLNPMYPFIRLFSHQCFGIATK